MLQIKQLFCRRVRRGQATRRRGPGRQPPAPAEAKPTRDSCRIAPPPAGCHAGVSLDRRRRVRRGQATPPSGTGKLAVSLVERMPMKPNKVLLGSIMAACCVHGDVELAESLMDLLLQVEPETHSDYVLLLKIYAAMGRWEGVGRVRGLMKGIGVKKKPGFSAVEIDGGVHQFVAGDGSDESYDLLGLLHFDIEELHCCEPGEALCTGAIWD